MASTDLRTRRSAHPHPNYSLKLVVELYEFPRWLQRKSTSTPRFSRIRGRKMVYYLVSSSRPVIHASWAVRLLMVLGV